MTLDEFLKSEGNIIGRSEWLLLEQSDIDGFGRVTKDPEPMHIDPEWCKENSPFGKTIAYGFQTVSLLTVLMHSATDSLFSGENGEKRFPLNYGFDYLRLINPVKVGNRIRGIFELVEVIEKKPNEFLSKLKATIEIEGETTPALSALWLIYWIEDSQGFVPKNKTEGS